MILRFGLVGGFTTAVDLALFALLVPLVGLPALANLLSYSTGIALSFLLNRLWTFQVGRDVGLWRQAGRFLASNAAGLALSTALVGILSIVLPALAAKLIAVPIVFCWNFALAKTWVFR